MTYTTFRIHLDGTRSERAEHNDHAEMIEWVAAAHGRFASIEVINNTTGEVRVFTDAGEQWQRVS